MIKLLPLILCIMSLQVVCAQPAGWTLYNASTTNGIVDENVFCSLISSNNEYWFGTDQGAIQYNLENHTYIKYDVVNTPASLPGNKIYDLVEDTEQSIWIATTAGIGKYVTTSATWEIIRTTDGLPNNYVRDLHMDADGLIWCATYGGGVCVLLDNGWQVFDQNDGLISNFCYSIHAIDSNNVWVGTNTGLSVYDGNNWISYSVNDGLPSNNVLSITDNNGEIWVSTDQGVAVLSGSSWLIYDDTNGLPDNLAYQVSSDQNGLIWAATDNGAASFDGNNWTTLDTLSGLNGNKVLSIHLHDGARFFSLEGAGADLIEGGAITHFRNDVGLPLSSFSCLAEAPDGSIWCGSNSYSYYYNSVYQFDGASWVKHDLPYSYTSVRKMEFDQDGILWALSSNGLLTYNGYNWGVVNVPSFNAYSDIFIDSQNRKYIGGNGSFSYFDGSSWNLYSLEGQWESVSKFYEDDNGRIWILTAEKVYLFSEEQLDMILVHNGNGGRGYFYSPTGYDLIVSFSYTNHIHPIYYGFNSYQYNWPYDIIDSDTSSDDCFWMVSGNNQVYVFNGNEIFEIGDLGDGYSNEFLIDQEGYAWCATSEGIFKGPTDCVFEGSRHEYDVNEYDDIPQPLVSNYYSEPGFWVDAVYPNPADNVLNIGFSLEEEGECMVKIYNLQGEIIKINSFKGFRYYQSRPIDVSELPSGQYLYSFWLNGELRIRSKVIITH